MTDDPTQTVLAPPNTSLSNRKYHTDLECPNASDRAREVTLERAHRMNLEECSVCSGEARIGNDGGDRTIYETLVEADPDAVGVDLGR